MSVAIENFLTDPNRNTYLALRALVLDMPEYDFYSVDALELGDMVDRQQYDDALQFGQSLMPVWFLSPRVHQLMSVAAARLGRQDQAAAEELIAISLLQALLKSGNGTPLLPLLTTYLTDEYDILLQLNCGALNQRHVTTDNGMFDVFDCLDGKELWFDVSVMARHSD